MRSALQGLKTSLQKGKQSTDEFIVGLDIGTENVKAVIARVGQETLDIVGVGRAHQGIADMQAGAIADIAAVVRNCDAALAEAETQAGVTVRTAVIGIAGELVKGTTTTVRCTRKDATKPLDISEVEQIISLVQARAEEQTKQQLGWELGGKNIDIRLVNSALVSIDIDGYQVTNPVGFQGSEVLVQLYTAYAPLIHIGALERVAQELDLDLLAVAAEPFAVARSVIGNDNNNTTSAILMDIGGGTTDIAVLHEGGVQGTKMFGIGGRAFTKAIQKESGVDFEKAEAIKLGLSNGHISATKAGPVEKVLTKTLDVWSSGVELALAEFTMIDSLPNTIWLCGGGASLALLSERLAYDDWYKSLPFTRRPSVKHITPDDVVGIRDNTGTIGDHTWITAMGLLRVGHDTLVQQDANKKGGSVREKIDRMLRV